MITFLSLHGLDLLTTILGLIYLWLEYRASIWLWAVSIIMPLLDIVLYYQHGLYGDAGMACYYTVAAVYGYIVWKISERQESPDSIVQEEADKSDGGQSVRGIRHFRKEHVLPAILFFFLAWGVTWWVLRYHTNSTVPVTDALTNALSFVALWALSKKYVEQWLIWLVVDLICTYLYVMKGIPFKAALYGIYCIVAVAGYRKWRKMAGQG